MASASPDPDAEPEKNDNRLPAWVTMPGGSVMHPDFLSILNGPGAR
jgi:hypothetical protein